MKALTVYQPWASLIAQGHKRYETRSWSTRYRGAIAIHAGKRFTAEERQAIRLYEHMYPALMDWDDLPLGAIVAVCRLLACVRTEAVRDEITAMERNFGNFQNGRFAWELEIIKLPELPIMAKGAQGIWDWTP